MDNPKRITNASGETPHNGVDVGDNQQHVLDADIMRRRREKAFLEVVGFAEVAEHKAVNGYSSINIPAVDVSNPSPIQNSTSASDSYLRTPLIDISSMGNDSISGDVDNPKQHFPQHHPESTQLFLAPEAALHRDGEQARLVEVVRRRQIQQRRHNEESTYQWLEESAMQFWESILVYGGIRDDPRNNIPINPGTHSTIPMNPYRSQSRQELNYTDFMKTGSNISSAGTKTNEQFADRCNGDESPSNLRQISQLIFRNILQVLYAFIDFCITRLAPLEPLQTCVDSTAPTYTLQISADDILRFWAIQCAFLLLSSWMQTFAFPLVVMMCLTIGSVSRKLARSPPKLNRRLVHRQHKQHGSSEAEVSNEMPAAKSTPNISSRLTNSLLRECAIQSLHSNNPGATPAECERFFTAVKQNEDAASKRIGDFLKWRSDCGLESTVEADGSSSHTGNSLESEGNIRVFDQSFADKDEEHWNAAAQIAISIITKRHVPENAPKLPQIICSYEEKFVNIIRSEKKANPTNEPPPRCKDGTRILHILPFRLDLSIATAQTYSLAVALYLDRRLCRWTTERITLFCDVRGGRGWANPTPWSALPFIQSTASLLGSNYPERLERLVLFPMPLSASWVWSAARKFLDPDTSSKVIVISSGDDLQEKLREFVDEDSLNVLEKRRRRSFVAEQTNPMQNSIVG